MVLVANVVAAEWICYELADQGLANVLGLETLRHGTNLINYLGIRIFGGLPSHGNKMTGSTLGFVNDDTRDRFYVFNDSQWKSDLTLGSVDIGKYTGWWGKRCGPLGFNFLSGFKATLYYLHLPLPDSKRRIITNIFLGSMGILGGLISVAIVPTLKFRVTPEEASSKFQSDPGLEGEASYTTHHLAMWKIGLLGTLTQGLNINVFSRIYQNPCKMMTGVIQITAAVGLSALGLYLYPEASSLVLPVGAGLIALA